MHLTIPFASSIDDNAQAATQQLRLPNLSQLLRFQTNCERLVGTEFDFLLPHEKSHLVRSQTAQLHLCHWRVGIDDIRMDDPAGLQLSEVESSQLIGAMQPYFHEDGLSLNLDATQIAVSGSAIDELMAHQLLASPDRVMGRHVQEWLPSLSFAGGKTLRRLQNEMQMLLYTHPVNEARESKGLPTVNSFWVSESNNWGQIPINFDLREPALSADWDQWSQVWTALDSSLIKDLLSKVLTGETISLSLSGERHCDTYTFAKPIDIWPAALHALRGLWHKPSAASALLNL